MTTLDPSTVATMQGRELDATVHERLFAEEPCDCVPATGIGRFHPMTGRCVLCGGQAAPRYSTDPAAFFAVVEKVREAGWEWESHHSGKKVVLYGHGRTLYGYGDTLPIAFARAALLTTITKDGGAS